MYNDLLNGLYSYVENEYSSKVDGFTYYAVVNNLFFKTISSRPYLISNLSDIILNRNLTRIKTEKSADLCYKIFNDFDIPITEYKLYLAVTVALGAETELILNINDGKLKMTYDKLAKTTNKLLFTMLKIKESEIKVIISDSTKISDTINVDLILEYLISSYSWLQS